jgi:spoIIIJ-associated protein
MLSDLQKQELSDILKSMLEKMGIPARVSPEDNLNGTEFNIYTPDSRLLIGQHGANLAALQMVMNTIAFRKYETVERFVLDIDDYRKQREYRLRELAKRALEDLKRTGQPVHFEPMNAYERRVVHAYLSTESGIETESSGTEPNRHIVVKLKEIGAI